MPKELSPYFASLSKQKRICPQCLSRPLRIEPSLNPDVAYETCACGYIYTIEAPTNAKAGDASSPKVLRPDFNRREE